MPTYELAPSAKGRKLRGAQDQQGLLPHKQTECAIEFVNTREWQIPAKVNVLLGGVGDLNNPLPAGSLLRGVLAELQTLVALPADWDGYGAPPIAPDVVVNAIAFLNDVASPGLMVPAIVPTGLGRVQIEWHRSGVELDVEVGPDGTFEASYRGPDGELDWTWYATSGVPPELARRLVAAPISFALLS